MCFNNLSAAVYNHSFWDTVMEVVLSTMYVWRSVIINPQNAQMFSYKPRNLLFFCFFNLKSSLHLNTYILTRDPTLDVI